MNPTVYCAPCDRWHKLDAKGEALRLHRIALMRASPLAMVLWKVVRSAHEQPPALPRPSLESIPHD